MRTLALLVVLLSSGALCAAYYSQREREDWQATLDQERERGRRLDDVLERCHAFNGFLTITLTDVVAGRRTLAQASRTLYGYATVHYPMHLENIDRMLPGPNLRAKVTQQLSEWVLQPGPWSNSQRPGPAFRERLERELAEALGEATLAPMVH